VEESVVGKGKSPLKKSSATHFYAGGWGDWDDPSPPNYRKLGGTSRCRQMISVDGSAVLNSRMLASAGYDRGMLLTKLLKIAKRIGRSNRCRKAFIIGMMLLPMLLLLPAVAERFSEIAPDQKFGEIIQIVLIAALIALWQYGTAIWVWPADPNRHIPDEDDF
jgi:hypothetical protein